MNGLAQLSEDLQTHAGLCEELLLMAQNESQELGSLNPELFQRRKALLPRLDISLARLRRHRTAWLQLDPSIREQNRHIHAALQQNQQLIMRIVALQRDNEQARLRRGLLPASQLPSVNRERPHFVAELYRRYSNA